MDEFWQQDKLILVIGLFQFGIISLMSLILNSNSNSNQHKVFDQAIMKPLPQDEPNAMPEQSSHLIANQLPQPIGANAGEVNGQEKETITSSYSIEISPELFKELLEISNNPAATVDEAIRWWLHRRNLDAIGAIKDRRDRLGMRSHRSWKSIEESGND